MSKSSKGQQWARVHGTLTLIWLLLIVPSILLWSESLLWIVFMSVWANVYGAASAWQAAKAEDASENERNQHYD